MSKFKPFVACVAFITGFLAANPAWSQSRTFSAWSANCAADLYCTTQTSGENGSLLRLERYAEQTFWQLSVELPAGLSTDFYRPVSLAVDGTATQFEAFEDVGAYGRLEDLHFLGSGAQSVLDAMVNGSDAELDLSDDDAEARSFGFSLAGLSAALLWIDEQQRRVGSERVTGEPPYGLPPVGGPVDWSFEIPPELIEVHRADDDCEPFEWLPNGRDITSDALDESIGIVSLPCYAGAYNFASKFYRIEDGAITKLDFAEYGDYTSWQATDTLVNAWYDPRAHEIGMFNKGRGIADCGSSATWRWTGGFFRLEEYRFKGDCDGEGDPGDFPVIFTAKPITEE